MWSFLSQVLRDGKEASCQAAVARVVSHCQQQGLPAPTVDTGDYCRARAKLSAAALRELSCEVAEELDIRGIKSNLSLGHVRCKSPEMVHREVWTTLLGYNLIRTTAAGAALLHDEQPRQISFTSTCQYVLALGCNGRVG